MRNRLKPTCETIAIAALLLLANLSEAMTKTNVNPLTSTGFISLGPPANAPGPAQLPQIQTLTQWLSRQALAQNTTSAPGQSDANNRGRQAAISRLETVAAKKLTMAFRKNGTPSEIKGGTLELHSSAAANHVGSRNEETARNFLRANRGLLLLDDPDHELALAGTESDSLGHQHLLFGQTYKDLRVWPCQLTLHANSEGNIDSMDGAFVPTPRNTSVNASLTAEQAFQIARDSLVHGEQSEISKSELIVYGPLDAASRLAWKFDLVHSVRQAWRCVVDANDGSLLASFSLIQDGAVTGSGMDGQGTTRTLNLWQQGSTFYMIDTSKPMYNPASTPPVISNVFGAILIFDAMNQPPNSNPDLSSVSAGLVSSASATTGWVPDAVGAAFGLSETFDYYKARHSRNSLDGNGGSILGIVRFGLNMKNAFWQGQLKVMFFGDGLPSALDVCGHELTHGVVQTIANGEGLVHGNQPGALNEALADIFGKSVELRTKGTNNWLIGFGTSLGVIRNLANPGALQTYGHPYPSKMSEYIPLSNDQNGDFGGVHANSTVISHCYYLLVQGLNSPIPPQDGERIFYRALTVHILSQSQFIDVRHACVSSAEEIFGVGSAQALKTAEAFDAVEVVDAPTTPNPSPIPTVPSPDSTLCLRLDPFAGYYLVRRETAFSDTSSGTFIYTIRYLSHQRVAVSGDGSLALFVTDNNNYGLVNTDGTFPVLSATNTAGVVHSLAMTPDKQKFAFSLLGPSGQPTNQVLIIDLAVQTSKIIKLYAPADDGNPLDIIKYADVMDFKSDGRTLIFDAYAEAPATSGGTFSGWTMYSMDLATTNISFLVKLNSDLDFGNPALGKSRNDLLTFEAIDKQAGVSTVLALDLTAGVIGNAGQIVGIAAPDYAGDDRAIIYSYPDFVNSDYSLVRQPLGSNSVTTNGPLALWLSDGDEVTMYRRGNYVISNSLPAITVNAPTNGQIFVPPANIQIQTAPNDTDGTIAKVEFYQGSTKLGERTNNPYSLTWSNVPAGKYRVSARAIDNLGGATDSSQISIIVANRPRLTNAIRLNPNLFQFNLVGDAGFSYVVQQSSNLINWSSLATVSNVNGSVPVQDSTVAGQARRFYRALLQ